jgi:hypothetical protein
LTVILKWFETWSPTLSDEHSLRVFENKLLRILFWPNKDEVTEERGRLHNEEFCDLYSSPNIIRVIKNMTGETRSTYGGEERCIQGLVGKPMGKRPLGRPRYILEGNIKMDLPVSFSKRTLLCEVR